MNPTTPEARNRATVERYFALMNAGDALGALRECCRADVVQEEFPNRLLPDGARRDLAALEEAAARGAALLAAQHFEVLGVHAAGDVVAVESVWTGTVGRDLGPFRAGMTLRARFAQFFELEDGRIRAIRNYDCFDPW